MGPLTEVEKIISTVMRRKKSSLHLPLPFSTAFHVTECFDSENAFRPDVQFARIDLVTGKTKLSWVAADITYGRTATDGGWNFETKGMTTTQAPSNTLRPDWTETNRSFGKTGGQQVRPKVRNCTPDNKMRYLRSTNLRHEC